MLKFKLRSEFSPCGDQGFAIGKLADGVNSGKRSQVLLGVTGSGKTFTMANIIERVQKPTLVLAHNKTLAAQLYQEFSTFFPDNAVEYFVSYYDYYQPEVYMERTDTYIEKSIAINDYIEQMRLRATKSLIERDDVIIVASVSCIYGLGMPEYFAKMRFDISCGDPLNADNVMKSLSNIHYVEDFVKFPRGSFRIKDDVLEIFPAYEQSDIIKIAFEGNVVQSLSVVNVESGCVRDLDRIAIYPASHHVTPQHVREHAVQEIKKELSKRVKFFESCGKYAEAERVYERTMYDIEMIEEAGYCKGIENYSRYFAARAEGSPPFCLLNYFKKPFLTFVDESHQTIPQIQAMSRGDRARKTSLVNYGFRLPCAYDNRPLTFEETQQLINQVIYVSATPGKWEISESDDGEVVEQILRPTGLLDPMIDIRPASSQIEDVIEEARRQICLGNKIIITTLTKRLAEEISIYLSAINIRAKYLHADIKTIDRVKILNELRRGVFDVLVGINLLREGLDLPEVSLVAVLDADKMGFLRSKTSLIQICGRAARNVNGFVIMYADKITPAIQYTVDVTQKRRKLQKEHNKKFGITPMGIKKSLSLCSICDNM